MFWTLCLLACAGVVQVAGAPEATSEQCDRSQSREAVWIIDKVIAPLLEKHDYKLPAECHLDSALDMFAKQERHKKLVRKGVWRCDFDNKVRVSAAHCSYMVHHLECHYQWSCSPLELMAC